jgi:hypothetical protein
MALEKAFNELCDGFRKLKDGLAALQLTLREDLPREGSVLLVDHLADAVDDCLGWLDESFAAALEGCGVVGQTLNLDRARRSLTSCQRQFQFLEQRFRADLNSYERVQELTSFGRRRRGEWLAWAKSVRQGLEECGQSTEAVSAALITCWQEIAERAAMTSVSVHTTNIGQQIAAP